MDLSALAGIVGGVAVAGVGMIYSAVTGGGFWSLPNRIGGILAGAEAGNTRSFGMVTLVGVYFHMLLSAICGIAIVYFAHQLNIGFVFAGIAVGIFFWLFNHFLIGSASEGARKHVQFNPVWLVIEVLVTPAIRLRIALGVLDVTFLLHVLYGAVTGLVAIALIR
ncbi:hypothetical protein NKJ46_27555 [Mesorhizobium sp. M0166]|uniref:hypothetical protein n=1 Tax=Mesorhizobium sp. M0166 TaxID=2956902 RepID=UPI00333629DE